jgi:hypothetical protein
MLHIYIREFLQVVHKDQRRTFTLDIAFKAKLDTYRDIP